MTVLNTNTGPTADAGEDLILQLSSTEELSNKIIELNGQKSFDPDGEDLEFFWEVLQPSGFEDSLSSNTNAIHLLNKNLDKIYWECVQENTNLFELDYLAMSKEKNKIIEYELMIKALHPSRVSKWLDYHIENGGTTWNFEYIT